MKTRIVLGDTHGQWQAIKDIYDKENPDEVILLGDYCDSFEYTSQEILNCWNNIRELQKNHNGLFYLIMGNHDWHYINPNERYSGYSRETWVMMHNLLEDAWKNHELHIAYIDNINRTVYSHAGITNTWINDWGNPPIDELDRINEDALGFSHAKMYDIYGDSVWQGPLWVRPTSLIEDMYNDDIFNEGYHWTQIVGHTRTKNGKPILVDSNHNILQESLQESNDSDNIILWVIDTIPKYYIRETLNDGDVLVKRELVKNS